MNGLADDFGSGADADDDRALGRLEQMPKEISKWPRLARGWAGERTRPRVQFPASRRKTLFGETPNTTREDAYAPQTLGAAAISEIYFGISSRIRPLFRNLKWLRSR